MQGKKFYSPIMLVPAIILYTVLFIVPTIGGIGFSFTDWSVTSEKISFIGLDNYKEIFQASSYYLSSIIHTLIFTFITVVFKVVIGLVLAILLNEGIRTKDYLRTVFFIPYTLSPIIIGLMFISVLAPNGPLNSILRWVGLGALAHSWLTEANTVLASTMGVEVWRMAGWNMVIILAGLQMIPKMYYEVAHIDGAGSWNQFRFITIPFLMPSISVITVLDIIHGLKVFDIIFALTNGGPGSLSEVISTQVFREYSLGRYSVSNALNVVLFICTLIIALSIKKAITGEEDKA
jgi:ABC-type sugar transport systems, permease components